MRSHYRCVQSVITKVYQCHGKRTSGHKIRENREGRAGKENIRVRRLMAARAAMFPGH